MTPVEKMAVAVIKTGLPSRDFAINPICAEELAVAVPMARAAFEALREDVKRWTYEAHGCCDDWIAVEDYMDRSITAALDEQAG